MRAETILIKLLRGRVDIINPSVLVEIAKHSSPPNRFNLIRPRNEIAVTHQLNLRIYRTVRVLEYPPAKQPEGAARYNGNNSFQALPGLRRRIVL